MQPVRATNCGKLTPTGQDFQYVLPAIRGIQASREYYVSMFPLRFIPQLLVAEPELSPEQRAQRRLNRSRIPEISRYILSNPEDYVFSAITVSIDAEVRFEQYGEQGSAGRTGLLHIPMDARFVVNDGQHRRAAIEMALKERPELGDETIAVVFFLDAGLARSQQMFADLNRHAVRPSKSIGLLYDYRDQMAVLVKKLIASLPAFQGLIDKEKTTLSPRSRHLFTLSALYHATVELLGQVEGNEIEERLQRAIRFWEVVDQHLKEWGQVRRGEITAGEVRKDYLHTHSVVLQAFARVGSQLGQDYPADWENRLATLAEIDWRRSNWKLWEGRAMQAGSVSKGSRNVVLTANVLKGYLKLKLSPEEQRVENAFQGGDS